MEWLRATGEWLWLNLVARLRPIVEKVRFRRIVFLAAVIVVAIAFSQVITIDLAVIWVMDTAFYLEIASAVVIVAVTGHIQGLLRQAVRHILSGACRVPAIAQRLGWGRERSEKPPRRRLAARKPSEDDAAAWGLTALVAAQN
jgi:hypothetical protein